MAKQTLAARTVQRASLRRGPAWTLIDAVLLAAVLLALAVAVFAPALLADIGDTVLGIADYDPALGASPSSLLLVLGRAAIVLQVLFLLWNVREAPLGQRVAWAGISLGLLMNFARNYYSGNPATVSFILIQICLAYLIRRLTMRPTVWQQLQMNQARAEAAEIELAAEREERRQERAELVGDLRQMERMHCRASCGRAEARAVLQRVEESHGLPMTTWPPDPSETLGGTP